MRMKGFLREADYAVKERLTGAAHEHSMLPPAWYGLLFYLSCM
jgi:hypothetical protein